MGILTRVSDGISPELRRIAAQMQRPRQLVAVLGKQLEVDLRAHFRALDAKPNARGWPKRHFWRREGAMHTALTRVTDDSATVTVASPAVVHRVMGGRVDAKRGKALSIPISPEAYRAGSASLFPRELSMMKRRGKPPLLFEIRGLRLFLHYVLVKSVTHRADPTALPATAVLERSLLARARAVLARMLERRTRR